MNNSNTHIPVIPILNIYSPLSKPLVSSRRRWSQAASAVTVAIFFDLDVSHEDDI